MKFFGRSGHVDFRLVFEAGNTICLLLEPAAPAYKVLAATDCFLEKADIIREDIIEKSLFEIYNGPEAAQLSTGLGKVLQQKCTANLQLQSFSLNRREKFKTPDEGVWNITLLPTFTSSGAIAYITLRAENVSQLENIKRLGDNLPDGAIYQIVEETDGRLYFSYISAGVYSLLGLTVTEVIEDAQNLYELILPDDLELMKQKDIESMREMTPFECQIRMRTRDGQIKWIDCRSSPRLLEDGTFIADGMMADITERKQSEESLQKALKEAESANSAKSDFLANISHEIRTPMNAVIGISNLLSTAQLSQEKQKDLLVTLQNSADNLLGLINDMLDFARIEEGQIQLEEIDFDLLELAEKSLSVIRLKAQEKNIDLNVHYNANMPQQFIGDPLRIQQIMMNLLSNAVKFTENGSINLHIDQENGCVKIQVSDTGIGIALDKQDAIFNKFSQADLSTARIYGGSGLGLTICKALAEHMKGRISVTSTPGKGSIFTVWLQLKINKLASSMKIFDALPARDLKVSPLDRGSVLLVEDHYPNILVATTLLEELGYHFDVAKTGHEAIEKYSQGSWDIILMDLSMPGMDGFETSKHIRGLETENKSPQIPIIAMTAHAMEGIRQDCLKAGMNDYISKPYSATELMAKLEQFVGPSLQ